ncbi:ABC transporter permease [Solicola gregarius]|uniref:ABC transporter permease n=1 Tax=Solicola gregarius TaxID=2908642 RepID=A0AA46YN82_9ACTN|nr:ABC transporter permease [Solicola gregarius]UYM07334.1 ABC transporter permease [Solicola gregarius]
MLRVTFRNLLARKVRLALSALAIVLGVAFVAGSLIFTDTMRASFDGIVEGSSPDVTVRPVSETDNTFGSVDARTIPASLVAELRDVPDAERADGSVQGQDLFLLDSDDKIVGGQGAPTLSFNYDDAPAMTGEPAVTISEGKAPSGPDEVAVDESTADRAGYEIGDTVSMTSAGERSRLSAKLVGLAEFGGGGLAGASLVFFDTSTAQQIFLNGRNAFNTVSVTAAPGVSQDELRDEVAAAIPDGLEAVTGDTVSDETQDAIGPFLDIFSSILLVFAAIAVVVGTFLIVNTFSILVAQRSRELALLRALGASRRQVTRSVLLEAVVVGFIGSTIGLLIGWALAALLRALFALIGLDLSETPLVFSASTVVVSYLVGMIVTVVAAYLPARRASRIAPVAALRDDVALPESAIHVRVIVGCVLGAASVALLVVGLLSEGTSGLIEVGAGVFGLLMTAALLSPVLGVPVLRALGLAYRPMFRMVGRLATQNSLRNPRRTAATASALMIGLALVTTISILGASLNTSIEKSVKEEFQADFLLSNPTFTGFSPQITDDVRKLDEAGAVAATQIAFGDLDGDAATITGAETAELDQIYDFPMVSGSMEVGSGEVAVSESTADDRNLSVGDRVTLTFQSGKQRAEIAGIYEDSNVIGGVLVPYSALRGADIERRDFTTSVNAAEGVSASDLESALDRVVEDEPLVTVQDQADFIDTQRAQVDQLLLLVYALLALAIVIAVLGIINTLALSVIERTREIGLLRAVGLTRRQLRRMVRLESVAIAVLGAVLGIVMGVAFGIVLQRAMVDQGFTALSIPVTQLVLFVVIAAVVGVFAAVLPARRAARLDVLTAIAEE